MGNSGSYDKDCGGNARRIPPEDPGEKVTENHTQDVGNTGDRRGVTGVWDTYISYLHRLQEVEGGKVVGPTTDIQSMCTGARV